MENHSHQTKRQLFDLLMEAPIDERKRLLEQVGGSSPDLRDELISLLAHSGVETALLRAPIDQARNRESAPQPDVAQNHRGLRSGTNLRHFTIVQSLGDGAKGSVYLALDTSLSRMVVLKLTQQRDLEPTLLAKIDDERIVKILTVDEFPDHHCFGIVMPWIPAISLQECIDERVFHEKDAQTFLLKCLRKKIPSFSSDRANANIDALSWLLQCSLDIARGMSAAHQQEILHFDLKPSNILITSTGRAVITDFNISIDKNSFGSSLTGGTPEFMPPEQALHILEAYCDGTSATKLDEKADIFSFGKTMLHAGETFFAPLDPWRLLMNSCCAQKVTERPPSFDRIISDLEAITTWKRACTQNSLDRFSQILAKFSESSPFLTACFVILLPNAWASLMQVLYNQAFIVEAASPEQLKLFRLIVGPWNLLVFTLAGLAIWKISVKISRLRQYDVNQEDQNSERFLAQISRNLWTCGTLTLVGWTVGCLLFVTSLGLYVGPLEPYLVRHFIASFLIAMSLAAVYATIFYAYLLIGLELRRHFQPSGRLRPNLSLFATTWRKRITRLHVLSGLLPLVAASLIVWMEPNVKSSAELSSNSAAQEYPYQFLVVAFIVLACAGYFFCNKISLRLTSWLDSNSTA